MSIGIFGILVNESHYRVIGLKSFAFHIYVFQVICAHI